MVSSPTSRFQDTFWALRWKNQQNVYIYIFKPSAQSAQTSVNVVELYKFHDT